jgi:hypothetical protein
MGYDFRHADGDNGESHFEDWGAEWGLVKPLNEYAAEEQARRFLRLRQPMEAKVQVLTYLLLEWFDFGRQCGHADMTLKEQVASLQRLYEKQTPP